WVDLDLTDADGDLYTYYVVETGVPDGYEYVGITPGAEADGATLIFTCKNTPEDTKVKVIKKWEGITDEEKDVLTARVELHRKNADGSTTIMRILNADRTETSSGIILRGDYNTTRGNEVRETLSNANNWTVIFEGLPKYEADGKTLIEYIVKEVGVSNDFTVEIAQPDMTLLVPTATVTNTREGSLTVIKKWFNADGTEEWTETLPGGILVKLSAKRNGVDVSDIQLQQLLNGPTQVELNAANGWTYTWPSVHKNGMEYFVTEVSFVRGNQDNYERMDENGNFIAWDTPVSAAWNEEKKAFEVTVFNKRKPVEVILIKEDSKDSTKKLEGAAFRLFDETGREVKNANDPQGLYRTDAEGKVVFGSPAGKHLMISQTGNIHRYMLIEEVAPKGYINNQAKISVTFYVKMTDGSPQVVIEKGQAWDNGNGGVMVSQDRAQWMVIRMKNEAVTYTLPETGGMGTGGYTTAGFMLMCMAALFYIVTNQRFTKQFHTNRFVRKK
ncbi:MAG: Cna B-type domain-containing protein, partial [Lachnospiraceae bacterium]|nr:Cna B-type domain-containing protein [Lachnospiraceae bacterium]